MNFIVNSLMKEKNKLEILNELILDTSYKQNESELLNISLKKIAHVIGFDCGFIVSLVGEGDKADIIGKYNLPYGLIEDIKSTVFEKTFIYQNLDFSSSISVITEFKPSKLEAAAKKYNIKTIIKLPIQGNSNDISAVMTLFSHKSSSHFDKHKAFLKTLSSTIHILLKKQKENEEYHNKLIRSEKLRALGELAGGVAHDFNNLLSAILGLSQIALSNQLDNETKQYFEIINRSALDGKDLVEKIQGFNRKNSSKPREAHFLNSLVQSSIEIVKPRWKNTYESNGIRLELATKLESQSEIYCNEFEIREVLINILMNAMDAMENGGALIIRTYDKDEKAVIEIQDTGNGIPDEIKDKIFEPFFSTKDTKGTGLGLSIVKNILDDHEGSIEVDTKLGFGTKFILSFDKYLEDKDIVNTKEEIKENLMFKGLKVLVVDDKLFVAEVLAKMLKLFKIEADIENCGSNVMDRLSKRRYDIILCDLAMPIMNGTEVAAHVKKLYPEIKFILITGWNKNSADYRNDVIDYVLMKPCTIDELATAIKEVTAKAIVN